MLFNSDPAARSHYGRADNPLTSPPPRPSRPPGTSRWRRVLGGLTLTGFLGFAIFGFPYLVTGGADITVYEGAGFTTVAGERVVLVPYSRVGTVEPWSDIFQLRLAAIALDSGETVWDEQLTDDLSRESRVLVAGKKYAYLVSGKGLLIVAVADGELVAQGSQIAGLEERHLAAWDAYAYDPATETILALDRDGGINTIRLDEQTAHPAPKRVTAAWRGTLSDGPFAPTELTSEDEALLAPDRIARLGPPTGGQYTGIDGASSLRIETLSGEYRQLNERVFHDASILVDETTVVGDIPGGIRAAQGWGGRLGSSVDGGTGTVAGLAADLILVRHKLSDDDTGEAVTVMSLKTGEVLDTVETPGEVGTAVCEPDGTVVFPLESGSISSEYDRIAVVKPSGRVTVIDIGARSPLGGL